MESFFKSAIIPNGNIFNLKDKNNHWNVFRLGDIESQAASTI